jgi:hypothetical protein
LGIVACDLFSVARGAGDLSLSSGEILPGAVLDSLMELVRFEGLGRQEVVQLGVETELGDADHGLAQDASLRPSLRRQPADGHLAVLAETLPISWRPDRQPL